MNASITDHARSRWFERFPDLSLTECLSRALPVGQLVSRMLRMQGGAQAFFDPTTNALFVVSSDNRVLTAYRPRYRGEITLLRRSVGAPLLRRAS